MDLNDFFASLLHELSSVNFVEKADLEREVFIVRGRIILKKNRILQVYFNELTHTTAFALIENNKRIWGIDYDNIRGWHEHPIKNTESHIDLPKQTIKGIISALKKNWKKLVIPHKYE